MLRPMSKVVGAAAFSSAEMDSPWPRDTSQQCLQGADLTGICNPNQYHPQHPCRMWPECTQAGVPDSPERGLCQREKKARPQKFQK